MLKPKRKITKKEIKRDPFLETVDKIEYNFQKNKGVYVKIIIGIVAIFIFINHLININNQKNIDSKAALGIALVAFEKGDYESAKFQFENIISEFNNTESFYISNYYLGKIAYEDNRLLIARDYLVKYYKKPEPDIFLTGAVKMLSKIAIHENNKEKAISLLDQVIKKVDSKIVKVELEIYKANLLISIGDNSIAVMILEDLLKNKDISSANKSEVQELLGMI